MNVMQLLAEARPAGLDPKPDPARRARDLAAAMAAEQSPQRAVGNRPAPRTRRVRVAVLGTGLTAVAVAVVTTVALESASPPAPATRHTATRHTPAATSSSVQSAILTAFGTLTGDIFYDRQTDTTGNSVTENWYYPWQPQTGQEVRARFELLRASNADPFNMGITYRQPAAAASAHVIPMTTERQIDVEYGNRTWSLQMIKGAVVPPLVDPSDIRAEVASGYFRTVLKTQLDGHPAVKLIARDQVDGETVVETLWADAKTYVPLEDVHQTLRNGKVTETVQDSFEFLPPTPANLAQLNVTAPPGFTRTPTIEAPHVASR